MKKIIVLITICLISIFGLSQNTKKSDNNYKIEGTVTDFYGVPWEKANIRLKSRNEVYPPAERIERETQTDGNGNYSFSDLPEDSYELTLLRIGNIGTLEETKTTPIPVNEKVNRVDFGVEVGSISECQHSITGVVKDNKNKAIEGAKVSVINAFNQRKVLSELTDKNGNYSIRICTLGQYIVFANTPKYETQTTNLTFQNYKDFQKFVDFKLKPLSKELLDWRK